MCLVKTLKHTEATRPGPNLQFLNTLLWVMADFVVPGHSAVVERLRRRIELIRRHHINCENRYEKTAMERLEMDRQQTFALHQRCQQTKAKHKNKHRQQPAAGADPVPQRGTGGGGAELADGGNGTPGEQSRNSTLIAVSVERCLVAYDYSDDALCYALQVETERL